MAMVVKNNLSATRTLGQLNKNSKALSKSLAKVSSGQKIVSAGDAAAEYAISEKMRVRIRALGQSDANTQTGSSLLHIAEGAIQSQVDIMRNIKAKVIDAHNDTNTDVDRATIQKEINQSYDEIEHIALETTYNGKRILSGQHITDRIYSWDVRTKAEYWPNQASMEVIPDNYETEIGEDDGPFDTFHAYENNSSSVDSLGLSDSQVTSGGVDQENRVVKSTVGYSTVASASDMDGVGVTITVTDDDADNPQTYSYKFVFTTNTSTSYADSDATKVYVGNIADNADISKYLNKLATSFKSAVKSNSDLGSISTSVSGSDITFSMSNKDVTVSLSGFSADAETSTDADGNETTTKNAITSMSIAAAGEVTTEGADEETASFTIDLSSVGSASDLIDSLIYEDDDGRVWGKTITAAGTTYEFINSDESYALYSLQKTSGSTLIDLASLTDSDDVASDFANLLTAKIKNSEIVTDDSGTVTGVKISATKSGTAGNDQEITVKEASLSSYDIDYSDYFAENSSLTHDQLVDSLNYDGFHFYNNTNSSQWWNIQFTDNEYKDILGTRPASGTDTQDITTVEVDINDVTSAATLVSEIYEQAGETVASTGPYAFATYGTKLTIYDTRLYNTKSSSQLSEGQAEISDGVFDNVQQAKRNVLAEKVVIQDTDKAGQNLKIYIPKTTLDQIFGFIPGSFDVEEYNVYTSDMRESLLGDDENEGIIDKGINYLLDAQTLIGAQTTRLEMSHNNLTTQVENTVASESVIRDADMAKEMVDYTKNNVLLQASQSMLAQANQNSEGVLSLLG